MTSRRSLLLMLVPPLTAALAVTVVLAMLELPSLIVVHWGFDGADRFGSVADLIAPVVVIVPALLAVMVGIFVTMTRRGSSTGLERIMVGIINFVGIGVPLAMLATALGQLNRPDVAGSTVALGICLGFLCAIVAAIGLALLTRPVTPAEPEALGAPALDLGDTERASWSRSVTPSIAPVLVVLGAVTLVVAILVIAGAPLLLTLLLLVLFAAIFTQLVWRVRIDSRGIVVRSILGLPRFAITPAQITEARAITVNPVGQFGGWGIRFGALGWGVIARGGDAIEVVRADGKTPFIVTVDDAATAAALLTAIARREHSKRA